jgi:hypothetical protein
MKFLILFLFLTSSALAQQLKVSSCKNAFYANGGKLKKNQQIGHERKVEIKNGGELGISFARWYVFLGPGKYDIDSVIREQKKRKDYIIDDSIFSVLTENKLLACRQAGIQCRHPSLLKKDDRTIQTTADSIALAWDFKTWLCRKILRGNTKFI